VLGPDRARREEQHEQQDITGTSTRAAPSGPKESLRWPSTS
jgi:hypothetical protein